MKEYSEYEDLNPNFKKALIEGMQDKAPFWRLIGMELVDARKGWAKVRLPFAEKLKQPYGVAHGGSIFSPADAAVAMALVGLVDRDESFTTVEMKINYLLPFTEGEIAAEARIIFKGSRTAIGDVEVRNDRGELLAKALATYLIFKNNSRDDFPV